VFILGLYQDPSRAERITPQLVEALVIRGNQKRQLGELQSQHELLANVKRTRQRCRRNLEPYLNYALSNTLSVRWFPGEPPQKLSVSDSDEEVESVPVKIPAQEGRTFGVRGSGDGQFGRAPNHWGIQGIAGAGGLLFVADTENGRVVVARRDGAFVRTIERYGVDSEKFQRIQGLCASNDELFVADAGANRIVVLTFDGVWLRTFGGLGSGEGQFNQPHGVSVTDDIVLVADTDNHRVVVLRRDGGFVHTFGKMGNAQGEFLRPCGVALQGERVFVADTSNHRVVITDLQASQFIYVGGFTFAFGIFMYPSHLFCDGTQVFVSDKGNDRVVVIDLEGKALRQFGKPLRDYRHDELKGPCATWAHGADVFVADSRNCRVLHHSIVN
jgi:DNA-binding beta-propeller fold protein YncE